MMVVVCHKCRCSNQFGALFCRNCGEKLKIVDQNHPDFNASRTVKRVIVRTMILLAVCSLVALIGAMFIPFGWPAGPEAGAEEIKQTRTDCESIDMALRTGKGSVVFVFTPAQASWGLNYLLDEKRPLPPLPTAMSGSGAGYARTASAAPSGGASAGVLQSRGSGPIKFGSGGSRSARASTMDAIAPAPKPAPPPPAPGGPSSGPQMVQAVDATPEAGVWKGHTNPSAKKSEAAPPAEPMLTAKYSISVNKNLDVNVAISGKMLYYLPYRLELTGELKESEPDKNGNTAPEFVYKSARFGRAPVPALLKQQALELFMLMASDKKLKAYAGRIKAVTVKAEDAIQVTVSR